ncbi:DUF1203 domain-containing protein [Pseudoxanthomonas winnipegensis]|uniref:DUF1203 domain-containing protein n=1 Tax=Pseudoxanthomonas winnipegensis TaxID=2480810 RepID=UPI002575997D|nr:DUF1203 domain-containing protein [Pseudoxanthomonas winnipegensis]WJI16372.1 DUF1203 domain-containing protein [Pseudoxanthomonas winnipegensis]
MSRFQLSGLDHRRFQPLFALDDAALAARGALRCRVDDAHGYPCRISLEDAALGEDVLLLPYAHQAVDSPYRSSGPIYVRARVTQAVLPPGEVPPYVSRRLISLRAYDRRDMMVDAQVHRGVDVAEALEAWFKSPAVAYAHLHNARQGCFSCLARRVA